MNDHTRIDPAAVEAGSGHPPAAVAGNILDCPLCGKPAAEDTLQPMSLDVGASFGIKKQGQLVLTSRHCARAECKTFCQLTLQLAKRRMGEAAKSIPKRLEA